MARKKTFFENKRVQKPREFWKGSPLFLREYGNPSIIAQNYDYLKAQVCLIRLIPWKKFLQIDQFFPLKLENISMF